MRVSIVSIDDWAAVYVDGRKVDALEGHSVRADDLLEEIYRRSEPVTDWESVWLDGTDLEKHMLETGDRFPDNLEDIPR